MAERRFDRLTQFDERSRAHPVRALVAGRPRRSFTWRCDVVLDQGQEGACVGFAWTHEALARPKPVVGLAAPDALAVYRRAQALDDYADGTEGTSVLAGAKASTENGWYSEYRWAFGEDDLALAVGYAGPAVLGVNWYAGMSEPDAAGNLHKAGELQGGHAILCRGYSTKRSAYLLHNSWGAAWGNTGTAWLSASDMAALLAEQGEACVPVLRTLPKLK